MTDEAAAQKSDRFWIEKRPDDFPLYNEETTGKREIGILALGVFLFAALVFCPPFVSRLARFLRSSSYFLIPALSLFFTLKGNLGAIFKRPRLYDIVIVVFGVVIMFVVSLSMMALGIRTGIIDPTKVQPNPIIGQKHDLIFVITFLVQIMGEELIKTAIFLLALILIFKKTNHRKPSVIIAVLITCFIFGVMHLTAYGNLGQVILVQGGAALVNAYQYVRTKNVLVPYATHLLFDTVAIIGAEFLCLLAF